MEESNLSELELLNIFNNLDSETLLNVCLSNSKFKNICHNDSSLRDKVRRQIIWTKEFKNLTEKQKEARLLGYILANDKLRVSILLEHNLGSSKYFLSTLNSYIDEDMAQFVFLNDKSIKYLTPQILISVDGNSVPVHAVYGDVVRENEYGFLLRRRQYFHYNDELIGKMPFLNLNPRNSNIEDLNSRVILELDENDMIIARSIGLV